jgi:transaldolase
MQNNHLKQLETFGQSVWLDYIRRDFITGGRLKQMIVEDGLTGITSNPAIFEKAVSESHDYVEYILAMKQKGMDAKEVYEGFSQRDVQTAADEFRTVYDRTDGRDGYVSLEVNPHLAHDTNKTIDEARRLWKALDRPNVLIKVPGTEEGLPAIRQLIIDGININVTLLFGLPRYRQVAVAYISGLEERVAAGKDLKRIASVASFFLSRIDTLIDPMLEKIIAGGGKNVMAAQQTLGQTAIASARMAYQIYKEIFGSSRFVELEKKGARRQRVLWASTGAKNPKYSDIKYVEPLIGPETVNTMPVDTINAYRDHGDPKDRLDRDIDASASLLGQLPELGINIDKLTQQLEDEGVKKFNIPFDKIIASLQHERT